MEPPHNPIKLGLMNMGSTLPSEPRDSLGPFRKRQNTWNVGGSLTRRIVFEPGPEHQVPCQIGGRRTDRISGQGEVSSLKLLDSGPPPLD